MDTIGLIPAGGVASRLGKIPCSKEIFPIHYSGSGKEISVVSENLIQCFKKSDIENIYFIIRKGKWDIPEYYGDGTEFGMNIGYLIVNLAYGTPFTLDQAYPFVMDKNIALGFPDIFFEPQNAYSELLKKLNRNNADAVLGIFPVESYLKWDMVEFDDRNNVKNIVIKQNRPDLNFGWTNVVWNPVFTEYMHNYLKEFLVKNPDGIKKTDNGNSRELYVGDVIQSAIRDGLKVEYVTFENGSSLDIGTPDDMRDYLKNNL
ncbi:MAG: hypothetical protein JXB24_14220 [Bacteroidales bacterium]|nr:hypothetical protein [Bacteroidales bacterium]